MFTLVFALTASYPMGTFLAQGDKEPHPQSTLESPEGTFRVLISPDCKRIASATIGHQAQLRELPGGKKQPALELERRISPVRFSKNGLFLIAVDEDRGLHGIRSESGKPLGQLKGHPEAFGQFPVDISSDGERVVSAAEGVVRQWNVRSIRLEKEWAPLKSVESVAISPDSKWVALAGSSLEKGVRVGAIAVWSLTEMRESWRIAENRQCFSVEWSADGKSLAVGTWGGYVILDGSTGRKRCSVQDSEASGEIQCVAFSPCGKRLATGYPMIRGTSSVEVWDVESGRRLKELPGHDCGVESLAFTPDGKSLVSASGDHKVRTWVLR